MNDILLQVSSVTKRYAEHTALDDVTLAVPRGSIYGFLGPNGAGKTTLIRIINRITAPDSGTVTLDGHPLRADDVYHIGYLPEERGLYKKMKVGDQAVFFARLKGLTKQEAITQLRWWFDRFGIADWWNKKVDELSKGMAQKVQFITTVLHRPKLLIFDEPFSGFDPINADLLKREILRLRDEGATVIFSTHNMASVEEMCDHITLINKSHNILSGPIEEVRSSMGTGRYSITFEGDAASLAEALEKCAVVEESREGAAIVRLISGASVRDVLAAANQAVTIQAFAKEIPTMNDIFIHTVNNYNNDNRQ